MTKRSCPQFLSAMPFSNLFEWLRDEHGGGAFHVIIRRGKSMELSGIVYIGAPLMRPLR